MPGKTLRKILYDISENIRVYNACQEDIRKAKEEKDKEDYYLNRIKKYNNFDTLKSTAETGKFYHDIVSYKNNGPYGCNKLEKFVDKVNKEMGEDLIVPIEYDSYDEYGPYDSDLEYPMSRCKISFSWANNK